jgi:hypothetical protein
VALEQALPSLDKPAKTGQTGVSGNHSSNPGYHPDNRKPYNSNNMQEMLQKNHPNSTVTSTTLPQKGDPGKKFAGQRNPESDVVYDKKGLPNFTDHMKYETELPTKRFFPAQGSKRELADMRQSHQRQATRQLRKDINSGKVSANQFDETQLTAIKGGKSKIPDHTWEHNPRSGRMQLLAEDKHKHTPHIGSVGLFGDRHKGK